jgi:hypothetical protein
MRTGYEMNSILRTTTTTTTIMGVVIEVKLTIMGTYAATFDFTMHGSPYTFLITKWSGRGFAKFGTLFFKASERDPNKFGLFSEAPDGTVSFSMDTAQKLNMIEQGVKDILACVDKIGCHYQRSVLDYAVWYREKHPEVDSYEQYITRAACCAIVHVDFLAPNINWDVVLFTI